MSAFLRAAFLALFMSHFALAAQSVDPIVQRGDFAYGMELTPETQGAVQTMLLPQSVYRGLTSSSLGDLRVYNAAGEEVPHAVRTLIDAERIDHGTVELPLFAIRGEPSEGGIAGDMSLQLKRSSDGRVLEVTTYDSVSPDDAAALPVVAYILDLGDLQRPAVALRLPLPEVHESFIASYTVETSSDLSSWSTLVSRTTLASLDRDGDRLQRTRVVFQQASQPYLRLRWLDSAPPMVLERAVLELASEAGVPSRRSVQLGGTPRAEEPNVYDFQSPGPLPVNRIQVELPESNTLVRAVVKTSPSPQGAWRTVLSGRFFRITNGEELRNDSHAIATHAAKYWALHVATQGGGLGGGLPSLELEYYPHQLAFVARGEGPFTLAFGRYGTAAGRFDWQDVAGLLSAAQLRALPNQSVVLGPVFELAGAKVQEAPLTDDRPKKMLLWGVLVLGVSILGVLSLRLIRSMN